MNLIEKIARDMWEFEMWELEKNVMSLPATQQNINITWHSLDIEIKEYWVSQAVRATQTIMSWLEPQNTVVTVPSDDFVLYLSKEVDKSVP